MPEIADCGIARSKDNDQAMKKELEARTEKFALRIIRLVSDLPKHKTADVLGWQVLKSATSMGANYREANRAQSRDDFIHKIAICEKESAETEYWLELMIEGNVAGGAEVSAVLQESGELLAIFVASGRTAKSSL